MGEQGRESEPQLRRALEQLPAIVWTTDRDLRITLMTGAGLAEGGATSEQYVGRTLQQSFGDHPRGAAPIAAHQRALGGESVEYEHEWAGHSYTAAVRPIRDDDGRIVGCVGMGTDITERKRTEQSLRETSSKLEAIFHAFPDLYFHLDAKGTYLGYHAGRLADLYAPPEAFLGRTIRDVMPGPLGEQLQQATERAIRDHRLETVEYDLPTPAGRQSFECRLSPMEGGQALAIVRNVTERRSLEEQFREAQKMEAVGRLAGGVAHDFNNVLTAILGYCHLLLTPLGEHAPQRGKLEQIRNAAERAANLTGQLLAFSRRQVLQPRVVSLNAIVTELGPMLERLIGEDIELITDLSQDLGHARLDPGQIGQVIMNLVVNARDAMPEGGRIALATSNLTVGDRPPHPTMARGDWVQLEVVDTGFGMDVETLARIYEPFFTTKEAGRGTGLGLSTVYGIVRQSGGAIVAESEPGRGAMFRVFFPAVTEAPPSVVPRAEPLTSTGSGEVVLVAEDEDEVRLLIADVLRSHGYVVLEAADGADALAVAARHDGRIHVLVADLVMPRKGGLDVARVLRREREGLKVLFVSGYSGGVELEAGASYLQKPFQADELAYRVRQILDS